MNNHTEIILCLLNVAALWLFFAFAVKDYARDRLRQKLFMIRDKLFDEVASTSRAFDAAYYINLRSYANQVIRRGHMCTPSRWFIFSLVSRIPFLVGGATPAEMRGQVDEEMQWLADAEKENPRVKEFRSAVHLQLMQYYMLTSPIVLITMVIAVPVLICAGSYYGLRKAAQVAFERLFADDIDRGSFADGDAVQCA